MTATEPPPRPRLDEMTDDMLDALYARLDAAFERADRLATDLTAEWDVSRRLLESRQEMAAERYAWQERGDRAEARAAELEAALDRVRATVTDLCDEPHPDHDHLCPDDVRRYVLDAIDGPARPAPGPEPAVHIGGSGNAEDCPACDLDRLPYPWICPGQPDPQS
ncbi:MULTISPECIES: hypothetical protein [Streptomyces]|uniref:Uncharacterized protein n=2 Tax=Streptomyces TaxID=1883 RepID=A0A124ECQ5_9ACTN|nr:MULTISPECIES: hypothetical protein [Streptomyces]KUH38406.1 hypothetical protein ATE80_13130 [Streptomyces kanasensis]UUS30853.1 hypothetical protein NRO40_08395 [Streptomyces changanensis]